jgi:hypothetical protein
MPEINPNVINAILRDIADFILSKAEENIIEMGISDRGFLLGSGEVSENPVESGFTAEYADAINSGTKPHSISEEGQNQIRAWVERKLSVPKNEVEKVTQSIIWSIRKKGTKPKPFFDKAIFDTLKNYRGNLDLT